MKQWQRLRSRRQMRRDLSPASLRSLAGEIKDIAELSSRLWARDEGLQERVKKICYEMDQLDRLLDKPSFQRLPEDKKKELRESLLLSRKELLKGLHSAPCPTNRRQ